MLVTAIAIRTVREPMGDQYAGNDDDRRGIAVDSSEMARPWMILVPWPVREAAAIDCTGRKLVPV
jgi:hypothetical protein